jgi:hypothetical protein
VPVAVFVTVDLLNHCNFSLLDIFSSLPQLIEGHLADNRTWNILKDHGLLNWQGGEWDGSARNFCVVIVVLLSFVPYVRKKKDHGDYTYLLSRK